MVTGAEPVVFDEYSDTISGPINFGPGSIKFATASTGDFVGREGLNIFVPTGYASGAPLSDTSTYAGQTIAGLGLTPGSYVYSFGSGAAADTFTVIIAGAASVPEPASLTLLSAAVVGFGAVYRRRRQPEA